MDGSSYARGSRGRSHLNHDSGSSRSRPASRNKHWSAIDGGARSDAQNHPGSERWERGGHRGGRGFGTSRGAPKMFSNVSLRLNQSPSRSGQPTRTPREHQPVHEPERQQDVEFEDAHAEDDEIYDVEESMVPEAGQGQIPLIVEPELETQEERDKFWQELVKAREQERKTAIAEGKMDDPLVPKRLEDAISIVGTCMYMCPRFERYRRERENNLFEWETIPGTKRVDHNRAVKMYERAAGDKTLPSDLRPPHVLKCTLDYLFHDLLPRGGFSATFNFIRDRSRSVRNDFTMQHITGPLAIECHDRCARFHILALHFERDRSGFSIPLEEQQLMNTLQSLKEFYEDQRGRYESPNELEMRVYHRLIHIRDQKERHEDIPDYITSHPVFKLTTAFRLHVQEKSAPISKTSTLVVTEEGMQIFGQLATVLNEQGSTVMVYLVACLLERLFGKDTIDDIEAIRGDLSISDIIDGVSSHRQVQDVQQDQVVQDAEQAEEDHEGEDEGEEYYDNEDGYDEGGEEGGYEPVTGPTPMFQSGAPAPLNSNTTTEWPASATLSQPSTVPVVGSAFAALVSKPNPFAAPSVFGTSFAPPSTSSGSVFGSTPSVFGTFGTPPSSETKPATSTFNTQPPPNPPPQTVAESSPFSSSGMAGSASKPTPSLFDPGTPQPNFFNIQPTSTPIPPPSTSQSNTTPSANILGGTNGSGFSNPFTATGSASATSSSSTAPPKPDAFSLNPLAPEFSLPSKSSIFSQHLSSLSTSTNGTPQVVPPDTSSQPTSFFSNPPPSTPAMEYKVNGASLFSSTPSSSSTPPLFFNKPSPPVSKSVTPPLTRPIAPPLLKIDTNTSTGSSSSSSVASPRVPPPMPKKQPISLPSTPTTVLQPQSALVGHLRNTLEGSSSGSWNWGSPTSSSQGILSPLIMASPMALDSKAFNNFTPLSTPKSLTRFRAPSISPIKNGISNGKIKAPDEPIYDVAAVEELKRKALEFAQRSLLVRQSFKRWVQRVTDRAAYLEARRHDEEYRQKLQRSGANGRAGPLALSGSRNGNGNDGAVVDKKRRMLANGAADGEHGPSPVKKRARKRMSSEYRPPRTDEELAKRFKENHEEHEERWAKGSFLKVIRKNVGKLNAATLKMPWNIWLSMNPESDATAIWLERKFDVPASGSWASETVFSIPLSSESRPEVSGYPGLIVFETTPSGDVSDELEKKYRILDDCSRLREIVKSLSPKRHFIPSLLIVSWDEQDSNFTTSDLFTMIKKLVADSEFLSYEVFAITSATKDLDNKLDHMLGKLNLDTEGKLVRTLKSEGVFKIFESTYESFLTEWMESCSLNGRFNWNLYGQLAQVSVNLFNVIFNSAQSLLELSGPKDPLPTFDYSNISDSESCYDTANKWLSTLSSRDDAVLVATDMQSHRNIGQDFPGRIFIEHLYEITENRFEQLHPASANTERAILITSIDSSLEAFKNALRPYQMKLSQAYNFSVRRSPKRRAYSIATSDLGSPEAKRVRLSASVASTNSDAAGVRTVPNTPQMNGNRQLESPSPTGSTVSAAATDFTERETPSVTVAMLRALTADLKKKYAVGSS